METTQRIDKDWVQSLEIIALAALNPKETHLNK